MSDLSRSMMADQARQRAAVWQRHADRGRWIERWDLGFAAFNIVAAVLNVFDGDWQWVPMNITCSLVLLGMCLLARSDRTRAEEAVYKWRWVELEASVPHE